MCPDDAAKKADGYIALVEVKNGHDNMKPDELDRTGNICHIKLAAFSRVFNVPAPDKGVAVVEPGVITKLQKMTGEAA